jgi:hypothetical protein
LLSQYGPVAVANTHRFMEEVQGNLLTPALKEAMVYLSQSELYTEAPAVLKLLTGIDQSQATFWRLAQDCGQQLEDRLLASSSGEPLTEEQIVYCMADGSLLYTDGGWQEVKVGRVFTEMPRWQGQADRPLLEASEYVAHLGDHRDFARKMDALIKKYAGLGKRVVCLGEGAIWLKHYWQQSLPEGRLILDFWHVMDKLAGLARQALPNELTRRLWLQEQRILLPNSDLAQVNQHVKALAEGKDTLQDAVDKVAQYLANNAFRMDYQRYLQQGLRIGSGAMEAAHRTLIQCRMKRSGQRWSEQGAQNLLNLRVAYKSGKAHLVRQIITGKAA